MLAETVQRSGAVQQTDPTWRLPDPLRRVLLLLPPLLLAGLEIIHPQPDETVQALMDASTWFASFHVIQLTLTGFVALSVLLLADSSGRANAWVTRLGIGVFLVFFSAYDAVAGIGTGLAMRSARDLSAAQQEGVFDVVRDWPAAGPPFALSIVGTLGWVAAVGGLALAARRQDAPRADGSSSRLRRCSCSEGTRSPSGRSRSAASSLVPSSTSFGCRIGTSSGLDDEFEHLELTCRQFFESWRRFKLSRASGELFDQSFRHRGAKSPPPSAMAGWQ